jgi:P4 family phage/plasmid primase-like protien
MKGVSAQTQPREKIVPTRISGRQVDEMAAGTLAYHEHDLRRFLDQHRVGSQEAAQASMTGMGATTGRWLIPDDKYPQFLDLLYDYLFVRRGRCMNFVEQPKRSEPKPLLIDLDFRYPEDTSVTRSFTLDMIEAFTHVVVDGIRFFFGTENYEELRFFVTLRPSPYREKGRLKDGVHIMCPDIALSNEKQAVLRRWVLTQGGVARAFRSTGYNNADEDVYDESMTRKQGWIFYGESKPNLPPYSLAAVFKYLPTEDDWQDEDTASYSPRDLMELLSVRYNIVPDGNVLRDGEAGDVYGKLLKAGAGGGGGHGAALTKSPALKPAPAPEDPIETAQQNAILEAIQALYPSAAKTDGERTMIRRFVMECLGESWYEQYDKWIRVGWCLHNIEASEEMFNLWMEFSAKSGKSAGNNTAALRQDWFYGMRKSGDGPRLTERSLRKWAREDNPEIYEQIISEDIHEYIQSQVEPTHYHISLLMKKMYGNNYVASINPKTTDWFKYDDEINMWKKLNQGLELKAKISYEVAQKINVTIGRLFGEIGKARGENKTGLADSLTEKTKDLHKVQFQLYSSGFTESVMKMAAQQFCEEEFHNKLNANPFLFGCRNGILELRAKAADGSDQVVFRQGRPEDYVSFLAGQNYPETEPINYVPYDAADPRQAEIADFFAKLFPNPELKRYTLRLLASTLEGANKEQCYYTFTGVGGNGKSKLIELMRLTLGDYQTSMQSTVLTRKRPESGAANPDIMATKCRRFIYMQEPDDKEPINTSRMKQFSGEDMVEARALYGDQEKFRIMGKMFMMCNRLPPVNSMDQGTWRRIKVIPFESKFVQDDHPELRIKKPNVFPRDPKLDEKLMKWREPFLSLLVHLYETEYIPHGLGKAPEVVDQASNKYKESFDIFARFKADRIREPMTPEEQMECRANPVDSKRIKMVLAAWKKENRIENNLSPNEVLLRLEDEYGHPDEGKFWPMFRIFGSDEEVAEWDKERIAAET